MYQGDNEIIEKIINVYGKEVKGEQRNEQRRNIKKIQTNR